MHGLLIALHIVCGSAQATSRPSGHRTVPRPRAYRAGSGKNFEEPGELNHDIVVFVEGLLISADDLVGVADLRLEVSYGDQSTRFFGHRS